MSGEEQLDGGNEVDVPKKKSYLHRVKDKAIKLKDKVKQSRKGHGEVAAEAEEESGEEQYQTPRRSDESMEANMDPIEEEEIETGVGNLSIKDTGAGAKPEAAKVTPGFGGGREKQDQGQEEKPMSSELKGNKEEFSSVRDHFDSKPKPEESLGQRESEGDQAQEKLVGFGYLGDSNSIEKQEAEAVKVTQGFGGGGEQQDQGQEEKPVSSELKDNSMEEFSSVNDNIDSKPKPEESLGQWESEGDQDQEKLGGSGFHGGSNSIEKQEEESPSRAGKTQWDGEGGEEKLGGSGFHGGSDSIEKQQEESPSRAGKNQWDGEGGEEKLGGSGFHGGSNSIEKQEEESPKRVGKTQWDGEGGKEEETPNFTEEFKSGGSEIGSGGMTKESGLDQELKDGVASDESIKDNEEDTIGEGECKGTQQKQNEEGEKGVQSYGQKISSMFGYGGQTNEKNNEMKKAEQIQGATSGTGTEAILEEESPWKTQKDGEGGEEEETPKFTDEVKFEEEPKFTEVKSEETPNFTEEVKSGGSGIGSGGMTKESGLGVKDVVASDESIKDNEEEDTIGEEESKVTQQKQHEEGEKGTESYGQQAKHAISSMFGYGGQTNEQNNEAK